MQTNKQNNLIVELSFEFALKIIRYAELLEADRKYIIARQLLKSGTSIGANVREAQNAESKADFIHKMKVAAKEADETEYWLLLCRCSENYKDCGDLLSDCVSIARVLSKIIGTSKMKAIS
ncbi:MAG: four helix bundle protein [Ferruginibacter sp.]